MGDQFAGQLIHLSRRLSSIQQQWLSWCGLFSCVCLDTITAFVLSPPPAGWTKIRVFQVFLFFFPQSTKMQHQLGTSEQKQKDQKAYVDQTRALFSRATTRELVGHKKEVSALPFCSLFVCVCF